MIRKLVLAAAALAPLASPALAQSVGGMTSTPGFYVNGEGGASFLPNLDLRNTPLGTLHEDFDTGAAYGGAVGYDMGNGMRVQLDALHQKADLNSVSGLAANGHLQSTSLMMNAQFDLLQSPLATPYVGVGAGMQHIGVNIQGLQDSDWKPAYQAEAGLRHDMTPNVSVFGEYRFSQSEAANLSDNGLFGRQHFADHALLAGITYHLTP